MARESREFMGAKLALFLGPRLLVLRRDDRPGLIWPGFWDLPGGGREGAEGPLDCVLRETREEFGLNVPSAQVRWGRAYTNSIGRAVWFFAGALPVTTAASVRLESEGQGWDLFTVDEFLNHRRMVPQFKLRLRDYLDGVKSDPPIKDPPLTVAGGGDEPQEEPARRGVSPDEFKVAGILAIT